MTGVVPAACSIPLRNWCVSAKSGTYCCSPEIGGACFLNQDGSPKALTNAESRGCCRIGQTCYQSNDDCNYGARERCTAGCFVTVWNEGDADSSRV